ncbi:MAG: hypothetical protein RMJ56_05465 [Gemmataceae bacterium]|nr:hypothetical protein [Gemmata sp.]MDW8197037.1 hypothetical protein [Gemmataceae bacterium]
MNRKLFVLGLFLLASGILLSATTNAADEAPAPRAVDDEAKKPGGKGKFGGFGGFGKFDPEKFKEMKGKFGFGKFDPEKFKEMKGKFGKEGGFGKFDPEKLKEWKGKLDKEGGFGKGGFGPKKGGDE